MDRQLDSGKTAPAGGHPMLERIRLVTKSFSFRIASITAQLFIVFGILESIIGYTEFTESLTKEYNDSAFRTADTAAAMVNGNRIGRYLETLGDSYEYRQVSSRLYQLCQKQNVTLIYVIAVNTDGYGDFQAVFDAENENSDYSHWNVGYRRNTTNEEYREIYRAIYEDHLERGSVLRTSSLNGAQPHITSLVPIKDTDGNVTAILCVQRPMSELAEGRHRFIMRIAFLTLVLIVFATLMAVLYFQEQFVSPMKKITREAERFAKENSRANTGELSNISRISEIEVLAGSLGRMESDTLAYISEITQMTARQERIGTELSVARNIQAAVLPCDFPPFPEHHEFDIYAIMTPAREIGGDFYDFFLIDDDHLGLVIADVSGKGVPAALFMMISKLLIKLRASSRSGGTPADMLADVNNTLCERNKLELFVSVWLAILTISTGDGIAANAGHEYPAVCRAGGQYEMIKYRHSPPVATMEGLRFRNNEFHMNPGDSLFVYTDGVTEAADQADELFGEERMLAALNRQPDADPQQVIENVQEGIRAFVGDAEQFDDITMLAMRYNGSEMRIQEVIQ